MLSNLSLCFGWPIACMPWENVSPYLALAASSWPKVLVFGLVCMIACFVRNEQVLVMEKKRLPPPCSCWFKLSEGFETLVLLDDPML